MSNHSHFKPVYFRPSLDWWVIGVVGALLAVLVAAIPTVLWTQQVSEPVTWISVIVVIGLILYFIDLTFYMVYILEEDSLVITSHFRHLRISYRMMRSIQPGGLTGLVSFFGHKRFALTGKNVIIKLAPGFLWRSVSVSPQQEHVFIETLLARIDHDRSSRAARSRGAEHS